VTVDLDLLADYVEGVLDPDEQARVQLLVQHDRDWASAHDALQAALPSVAAALASVNPVAMPASVLAATLRSFAAERAVDPSTALPDQTPGGAPRRDTTRPATGRPPTSSTKRARRRELRTAALSAFALVLVVAFGLGYLIRNNDQGANDSKATSGGAAAPQFALRFLHWPRRGQEGERLAFRHGLRPGAVGQHNAQLILAPLRRRLCLPERRGQQRQP